MTKPKTMEYEIVTAGSPDELARIINDRIRSGWFPTGPLTIGTDTNVVECPPWGLGWMRHLGVHFQVLKCSPIYGQTLCCCEPPRRLIHRTNPNVFRRFEEALRRTPQAYH